jgi:hypothetical protein
VDSVLPSEDDIFVDDSDKAVTPESDRDLCVGVGVGVANAGKSNVIVEDGTVCSLDET